MPTTTEALATDKQTAVQTILQRCVCLVLSCGYVGNSRKVELAGVDMSKDGESVNGEKSELGARKKLFSDADLRPCKSAIMAAKMFVRSCSLDGGHRVFGAGAHLVPVLAAGEVDARLTQFQADVRAKAQELVARLPAILDERRERLGKFFNVGDYPTPDGILNAFSIDWSYVSFGAPDQLKDADGAAYQRAVSSWDAKLSAAYDDVVLGLRESALIVMRELAERLKPGEDGKPKVLRPTALRDLQELLGRLPVLNSVGEDGELADTLAKVGAMAAGLDVETLRKAPGIRAMLLETAETATGELGRLVTSGRRAMSFGDGPVWT